MNWHLVRFNELSLNQLYQILMLRQAVFVVEQNCPYLDADNTDSDAEHLFACDDNGQIKAYARLFTANQHSCYSRIGRVLTDPSVRRTGLGRELMARAIEHLRHQAPDASIQVGAQVYLTEFYQSLGFNSISDEYLEDGIPHIDMERR